MYARQITSEETHTLAEARRIINKGEIHKREIFLNKVKQKLFGILAIGISIVSPLLLGDATISVLMLPLYIRNFPVFVYIVSTYEEIN